MRGKWLAAIVAGALSASACVVVVRFPTPIDHALTFLAIAITILAWVTHPAIQLAVPLLIGGEIAIADERLRLLSFGVVLALAFGFALCHSERSEESGRWRAALITIVAIMILRWIPFHEVRVWRELLLLIIAVAIIYALRGTPLAIAIAVATALFTPLIPLRTIGYAIVVLILAAIVRTRIEARVVASLTVATMLVFFAWSGVFARATLLALRGLPRSTPRAPLRMALAAGETVRLDVPADATAVILSGANVARLRPGTMIGAIDNKPIRIGEVSDWGFLRRAEHHASRNRMPQNPAGELRDYGQSAWIDGAARFPVRQSVTVSAAKTLPRDARLQIESFELVKR